MGQNAVCVAKDGKWGTIERRNYDGYKHGFGGQGEHVREIFL